MEIVNPEIETFLRQLLPKRQGLLAQMEYQAQKENIPIIKPEVAQLLHCLVTMHQPKRILEVGTAIGYSTLWLALAIGDSQGEAKVVSIEKDAQRFQEAQKNMELAGVKGLVELHAGDALEVLPNLKEKFDLLFIDAAKGQYLNLFELCFPLLNQGALIVADNVLFRGLVASAQIDKRYKTMVRKVKEYLQLVTTHPELETSVLPIGDGVAISYKKGV